MQSRIGYIVKLLFNDKYPKKDTDKLDKKVRLKLQKELAILKNECHDTEANLKPGIYNLDGSLQENPTPFEISDLGWSWERYHRASPFNAFICKDGAYVSVNP
jgi:hypothetical protein